MGDNENIDGKVSINIPTTITVPVEVHNTLIQDNAGNTKMRENSDDDFEDPDRNGKKQKMSNARARTTTKGNMLTPIQRKTENKKLKDENTKLANKLKQMEESFRKQANEMLAKFNEQMEQNKLQMQQQNNLQLQQIQQLTIKLNEKDENQKLKDNYKGLTKGNRFNVLINESENEEDDITSEMEIVDEGKDDQTVDTEINTLKTKNVLTPKQQQQKQQQQQVQQQQQKAKNINKNKNINIDNEIITNNNNNTTKKNTNNNDNNNIKNNNNTKTNNNDINTKKTNKKPPPIHVHHQDIRDSIKILKISGIENFNVKRISNYKHTIMTDNMKNYNEIKDIFNRAATPFFTYTPKELKPKTMILKGLHEYEETTEIKNELEQQNLIVMSVNQLTTKNSKENAKKLPIYIVQLAPETNMAQVYAINKLNHQTIKWENLKKKDTILQCHKCQRFGHASINCNLGYRCVKCSEDHVPGKCKIIEKTETSKLYCTNCNANGHPASFKGCPVYQTTLGRLKQKIKESRINSKPAIIPITKSTYVNEINGTFADVVNRNNNNNNNNNNNKNNNQTLYTNETNENENIIKNLNKKVDQLANTVAEQGEQLGTLMSLIRQLIETE